jgi:hypothetical protein
MFLTEMNTDQFFLTEKKYRQASSSSSSSVDSIIGGADPFGAFQLPQSSTTDMALHHCKSLVFVYCAIPDSSRGERFPKYAHGNQSKKSVVED